MGEGVEKMERKQLAQGLIQVYTGEGKSQTLAALGLALRAIGHGFKVLLIQFLPSAEVNNILAVQLFGDRLQVLQAGLTELRHGGQILPEARRRAQEILDCAKAALRQGDFDLVILDQINAALHLELLQVAKVLHALNHRAPHVEVVLTGPGAPLELIAAADLVTEMVSLKDELAEGNIDQ